MVTTPFDLQLELEDLLADLLFARRAGKLGRLALLAYCDCKGWARRAGKTDIADTALRMFTESPCLSKEEFLERIDHLITALERHRQANLLGRGGAFAVNAMATSQATVRR